MNTHAIIMAGGKGTRLMPLTKNMPKPMVNIIDKPILEYAIRHLVSFGVVDITLTLGYRPFDIINHFQDGADYGANLRYTIEHEPLGTAGSVKNAVDFEGDFFVLSGDALTNINLDVFMSAHKQMGGLVTMATKPMQNPVGLGILEVEKTGKITRFREKPEEEISLGLINTGIYVMHSDITKFIGDGFQDFSRQIFPKIMPTLRAHLTDSYWSDVGTLESYYLANRDVAVGAVVF